MDCLRHVMIYSQILAHSKKLGEDEPLNCSTADRKVRKFANDFPLVCYSHSIVPGGLLVMSNTQRFTPFCRRDAGKF
jgi:hypothetical protein